MLTSKFDAALVYASVVHGGQTRKGTSIPYLSHLLAVASIALEHGADEDDAIGALLHDAAEDQGGRDRLDDIALRFGEKVKKIVGECTDTYESPKPPWRPRKEQYVKGLATATSSGRLVSASDKLHNARSILADYRRIGDQLWERFNAPESDQRWYYNALVEAFGAAGDHGELINELDAVVKEIWPPS